MSLHHPRGFAALSARPSRLARLSPVRNALLTAAAVVATACGASGGSTEPFEAPPPAPLTFANAPDSLSVGDTLTLRVANVTDVGPLSVTWMSSNAAVVTVDSTGFVRARGTGLATITARRAVRSGSTTIRVYFR